MVANRLKNLVSLAKEAAKDVRQVLDDALNHLSHRAEPSLARIPVKNSPSGLQSIRLGGGSRRSFSTVTAFRAHAAVKGNAPRFIKPARPVGRIAARLSPYTTFIRPGLQGKLPFKPSGLYTNFVNLGARNFSTSGGNATREAVQNLTASLRCLFNNGGDLILNTKFNQKDSNSLQSYHGSLEQSQAEKTFKLATFESSNIEKLGSYIRFQFPDLELSIPSMSFMNGEILGSIEYDIVMVKAQIDAVFKQIQRIFDSYGSLPIERRAECIMVHFPNLELSEVERFMVDSGITGGVVFPSEKTLNLKESSSSSSVMSDSSAYQADSESYQTMSEYDSEAPALISSDSDSTSMESREFLPVLSSFDEIQTPSILSGESFFFTDVGAA